MSKNQLIKMQAKRMEEWLKGKHKRDGNISLSFLETVVAEIYNYIDMDHKKQNYLAKIAEFESTIEQRVHDKTISQAKKLITESQRIWAHKLIDSLGQNPDALENFLDEHYNANI